MSPSPLGAAGNGQKKVLSTLPAHPPPGPPQFPQAWRGCQKVYLQTGAASVPWKSGTISQRSVEKNRKVLSAEQPHWGDVPSVFLLRRHGDQGCLCITQGAITRGNHFTISALHTPESTLPGQADHTWIMYSHCTAFALESDLCSDLQGRDPGDQDFPPSAMLTVGSSGSSLSRRMF